MAEEYDLGEIVGGKIISDGGTAAHLVFDLANGKQAVVHASIEDAPEKEETEAQNEPEPEQQEAATESGEGEGAEA